MLEENKGDVKFDSRRRMPLDARIIGYCVVFGASISVLLGISLACGVSRISKPEVRLVALGLFRLTSQLSFGLYFLLLGFAYVVYGYGIARGYRFAWWLGLVTCSYTLCDFVLVASAYPSASTLGICMHSVMIAWLVFRRRLYGIGTRAQKGDRG